MNTKTIEVVCEYCNKWLVTDLDYSHIEWLDEALKHFDWSETEDGYLCPNCRVKYSGGNA